MAQRPGMFRTRREAVVWFLIVLLSAVVVLAVAAVVFTVVGLVPFVVGGIVLVVLIMSIVLVW